MILHIFGDSFSIPSTLYQHSSFKLWTEHLQELTKCDHIMNHAKEGVSNDYIFNCLLNESKNFQTDDVVIVQTTNAERQWFFKNKPELSNLYIKDIHEHISKNEYETIQNFIKYLDTTHLIPIHLTMFILAVDSIKIKFPSIKFCIVPGWDSVPQVQGNLIKVSNEEFVSSSALAKWYNTHKSDPRPNHIQHQKNHLVLAEKIHNFLFKDVQLNFEQGFETKFIN